MILKSWGQTAMQASRKGGGTAPQPAGGFKVATNRKTRPIFCANPFLGIVKHV